MQQLFSSDTRNKTLKYQIIEKVKMKYLKHLKELDVEYTEHKKRYGLKSMSEKELDKLLKLDI